MTNTTKQAATDNLKTWPEKFMFTIEILGKQPDHIPDYKLSEEIGNTVFVDSDHKLPVVEYIRSDKVKELQLATVQATLDKCNKEILAFDIDFDYLCPQQILDSLEKS